MILMGIPWTMEMETQYRYLLYLGCLLNVYFTGSEVFVCQSIAYIASSLSSVNVKLVFSGDEC